MTTTDDRVAELSAPGRRTSGRPLHPGDEGYDLGRQAWNRRVRHRPAAVVWAQSAEDVRRAVRRAGTRRLGVGVMATGHGTGTAVGADGVLVNTSPMRRVVVD